MSNTSSNDTAPFAPFLSEDWQTAAIAVNLILSFFTVCGNLLVIGAFWVDTSLRTKANYFLFSLACADLLVGLLAQPLYSSFFVHLKWEPPVVREVYEFLDVLFGVASILNLLSVTLVSAHAIARPLEQRAQSDRGYMIGAFVFPWCTALIPASAPIIAPNIQYDYAITTSVVCYFVPLALIIIAYILILGVVRRRKFIVDPGNTAQSVKQDLKAAMTMLIVTGCFVITWLPFFIVTLLIFHCKTCDKSVLVDMRLIISIKTFQYISSTINPVIYAFRRKSFKKAFLKIYKKLCPCCVQQSFTGNPSMAGQTSLRMQSQAHAPTHS